MDDECRAAFDASQKEMRSVLVEIDEAEAAIERIRDEQRRARKRAKFLMRSLEVTSAELRECQQQQPTEGASKKSSLPN